MIRLVEDPPAGKPASLIELVGKIFSPKGILSKSPNFEYRPQQQKMAVAVARALEEQEHLIVEAGTGVGKSLAYLIPAILFAVARHKKAVISTHTINLQEQLIDKDLPMLAKILPVKFNFTMLKGRQNYLCTRRLEKVGPAGRPAFHLARSSRNCGAFTNGPRKPRTAACRILRSSRTRGSGSRSVRNAAYARPSPAGIHPIS